MGYGIIYVHQLRICHCLQDIWLIGHEPANKNNSALAVPLLPSIFTACHFLTIKAGWKIRELNRRSCLPQIKAIIATM